MNAITHVSQVTKHYYKRTRYLFQNRFNLEIKQNEARSVTLSLHRDLRDKTFEEQNAAVSYLVPSCVQAFFSEFSLQWLKTPRPQRD